MDRNLFNLTKDNQIEFYQDGLDYETKYISLIKEAKKNIHLQTYIFELDAFGARVFFELIQAAKRGVDIYMVIDSIGSRLFTLQEEKELQSAGVHLIRFNSIQIKWLYSWGRRLHHKVLLVDEEVSIIGGINVNAVFNHRTGTPQLDFAHLLRGPVIPRLCKYLQDVYRKACGSKKMTFPEIAAPPVIYPGGVNVKILVNDWVYRRWQITRQYTHMTKQAKTQITIVSSYFFPRRVFMRQLVAAANRGVRVRLILPKFSDWPSYILASEFLYAYFLKNGVEIYQWKDSILHGKMATIDSDWSTLGSFNLNYTSYQQNLEMNVAVYSEEFTKDLNSKLDVLIHHGCIKLNPKDFLEHTPVKIKIQRFFYYVILAFVANFSIGMIYQEDEKKGNRLYNLLRIVGAIFFLILGIIGSILPVMPGIPFFFLSFILVYKQILLNKKKDVQ